MGIQRQTTVTTSIDLVELVAIQVLVDGTVVEKCMISVSISNTANKPIREAANKMVSRGVHHLLVVDDEDTG